MSFDLMENTNESLFEMEKPLEKIYRIKPSKKNAGEFISYSVFGKVIIVSNSNQLHEGYAKIVSYKEKDKCIIARMKNVAYDFYHSGDNDIPYDELCQVLRDLNFKKEYEEKIDEENNFYAWANLDTGVLITIETWNHIGLKCYNSVKVYIPNNGRFSPLAKGLDKMGMVSGSNRTIEFNITFSNNPYPLRSVLKLSSNSKNWDGETPLLSHYGDNRNEDLICPAYFKKMLLKIEKFEDDIGTLFNMRVQETIDNYDKEIKRWENTT